MRIALIGQAAFGKDVLSALLDANENVVAALCPPDLPNRSPDPVKDLATSANIPVFQYSRMRDKQAIEQFSQLQLDSSAHLTALFQLGVPDWRLDKLPHLIDELLSDTGLLIEDGLTLSDIQRLKEQGPTIHSLCQQLQQQGIPEGLVQCDFHDNNNLFNSCNTCTYQITESVPVQIL